MYCEASASNSFAGVSASSEKSIMGSVKEIQVQSSNGIQPSVHIIKKTNLDASMQRPIPSIIQNGAPVDTHELDSSSTAHQHRGTDKELSWIIRRVDVSAGEKVEPCKLKPGSNLTLGRELLWKEPVRTGIVDRRVSKTQVELEAHDSFILIKAGGKRACRVMINSMRKATTLSPGQAAHLGHCDSFELDHSQVGKYKFLVTLRTHDVSKAPKVSNGAVTTSDPLHSNVDQEKSLEREPGVSAMKELERENAERNEIGRATRPGGGCAAAANDPPTSANELDGDLQTTAKKENPASNSCDSAALDNFGSESTPPQLTGCNSGLKVDLSVVDDEPSLTISKHDDISSNILLDFAQPVGNCSPLFNPDQNEGGGCDSAFTQGAAAIATGSSDFADLSHGTDLKPPPHTSVGQDGLSQQSYVGQSANALDSSSHEHGTGTAPERHELNHSGMHVGDGGGIGHGESHVGQDGRHELNHLNHSESHVEGDGIGHGESHVEQDGRHELNHSESHVEGGGIGHGESHVEQDRRHELNHSESHVKGGGIGHGESHVEQEEGEVPGVGYGSPRRLWTQKAKAAHWHWPAGSELEDVHGEDDDLLSSLQPQQPSGLNLGGAVSASQVEANPYPRPLTLPAAEADPEQAHATVGHPIEARSKLSNAPRVGPEFQATIPAKNPLPFDPVVRMGDVPARGSFHAWAQVLEGPKCRKLDLDEVESTALERLDSKELEAFQQGLRDYPKDFYSISRYTPELRKYNTMQLVHYYYKHFKLSDGYREWKAWCVEQDKLHTHSEVLATIKSPGSAIQQKTLLSPSSKQNKSLMDTANESKSKALEHNDAKAIHTTKTNTTAVDSVAKNLVLTSATETKVDERAQVKSSNDIMESKTETIAPVVDTNAKVLDSSSFKGTVQEFRRLPEGPNSASTSPGEQSSQSCKRPHNNCSNERPSKVFKVEVSTQKYPDGNSNVPSGTNPKRRRSECSSSPESCAVRVGARKSVNLPISPASSPSMFPADSDGASYASPSYLATAETDKSQRRGSSWSSLDSSEFGRPLECGPQSRVNRVIALDGPDNTKRRKAEEVFCICQRTEKQCTEPGLLWVYCSKGTSQCGQWVHPKCFGLENTLDRSAWASVKDFVCPLCSADGLCRKAPSAFRVSSEKAAGRQFPNRSTVPDGGTCVVRQEYQVGTRLRSVLEIEGKPAGWVEGEIAEVDHRCKDAPYKVLYDEGTQCVAKWEGLGPNNPTTMLAVDWERCEALRVQDSMIRRQSRQGESSRSDSDVNAAPSGIHMEDKVCAKEVTSS